MARRPVDAELQELWDRIRCDWRFDHLRKTGAALVAGVGSYAPKVFIVGDAPGAYENTTERPFTGASGSALQSLIVDVAEIPIKDVWQTYVVKYRCGTGRPSAHVLAQFREHVRAEWRILGGPKVVVTIGQAALLSMDENAGFIRNCAGEPRERPGGVTLWPMLDPQTGLDRKELRPLLEQHWEDFGKWMRSRS